MSRAISAGPLRLGASTISHWRTTTFSCIVTARCSAGMHDFTQWLVVRQARWALPLVTPFL